MALCDSRVWLSLALAATLFNTLALSGSLLLFNFAYTVLDQLSGPLLSSQCRCHADALFPALIGGGSGVTPSSSIATSSCQEVESDV